MAQATLVLIPNFVQLVADDSANTLTIQTYNSATASWITQFTLNVGTGAVTLAQGLTVPTLTANTNVSTPAVDPSSTINSFAGTTAGTVYWTMPFQGSGYKKVIVFLDGYENDTTTAQTITYPTAFSQTPNIYNPSAVPGITTTTTTLSIDPDTPTAYTAWIIVEGY